MDGVLWAGDRPLPGLAAFFDALRARQVRFVLATNNASRTPEQFVAKLAGMGVAVSAAEVLTSAQATALYLREQPPAANDGRQPGRVFAIGDQGVRQALCEAGFDLCELYDLAAGTVVCGMDLGLSWDKLATATLNIRAGARFVGTNPDVTLPTERGITHGNGAILGALQIATGVAPVIVGKPEPIMFQQALRRLGTTAAETVVIGDRLDTDILGAVRAGLPSLLVLSGISQPADLATAASRPTWVLPSIVELSALLLGQLPASALEPLAALQAHGRP
ncbi:MAG: HAD-IIA family hydrolase [Anaerolineales bacterium]|nr:HAD-IIA family hydrolase [Anaerolineales bacterium]